MLTTAPPDACSALSMRSRSSSSRSAQYLRRSARSAQEKYSYCPGSAKYVVGPIAKGAHAASGHTAALPSATMNARCVIGDPYCARITRDANVKNGREKRKPRSACRRPGYSGRPMSPARPHPLNTFGAARSFILLARSVRMITSITAEARAGQAQLP